MPDRPEKLFKVSFDLPPESIDWPPVAVETLWAAKTGRKLELEVRNTPFYVNGIAFGDIIRVTPDDERREIIFEERLAASGNSTIRILIKNDTFESLIETALKDFGCDWEMESSGRLWAVNVPAEADYPTLREILGAQVDKDGIAVAEAAVSEAHTPSSA
ncbi:DUF4265 domain-containing protein [Kribbella antibiotica]|uniref:DUF4265 domain-containing protein n=1 Tax=Kribbella antibiotica TaxID=190195 RepID=A0A4R4ZRG6_9ACTN|nr:DUF4265 domain-containing protein [Kribbella antibiotica]TDD61355.1 DUF4265 domain-containing protein [Kribbella antibiotica]